MGINRQAPNASRYLDEDDEEEVITPVVRKARDEDEDDDEEPRANPALARAAARRRAVVSRDDEDEQEHPAARVPRPRRPAEDDDLPEEDPDVHSPTNSRVAAGWGAAKSLQSEGADYTQEFRLTEEGTLIKFISDEPFAVYRQHFLREKEGKKSYVCIGRECPLCNDLGHSPDKKFAFTVVDLSQETYGATMLVAGPRLLGILEKHNSGKYGPLDRHYWEISRSGTGQKTSYNLTLVKERDLADDYEIDPAKTEAVLRKIKPFTADVVKAPTKAELRQIVAELDA